jgi:hypothetical protein
MVRKRSVKPILNDKERRLEAERMESEPAKRVMVLPAPLPWRESQASIYQTEIWRDRFPDRKG